MVYGPVINGWLRAVGAPLTRRARNSNLRETHIQVKKKEPLIMAKAPPRQTSARVSSLASRVLSGATKPTPSQVRTLAASALGQDQTRGQSPKRK